MAYNAITSCSISMLRSWWQPDLNRAAVAFVCNGCVLQSDDDLCKKKRTKGGVPSLSCSVCFSWCSESVNDVLWWSSSYTKGPAVCLEEKWVVTRGLMYTSSLSNSLLITQSCCILAGLGNYVPDRWTLDLQDNRPTYHTSPTLQSMHTNAHHA